MLNPAIPILMYHQVTPRPHPALRKYSVTPLMFRLQMIWLALNGYHAITLNALVRHRLEHGPLPKRPVIITFDDGYVDCVNYAVPAMKAVGYTGVFYLVSGLMGRVSQWLVAERGVAAPLIDWPAARDLEKAGFQCGAHSVSHPHLSELDAAHCLAELTESRRMIEDRLGHAVTHLAYPFGAYNEQVRAMAEQAGYRTACSVRIGLSTAQDDLLALHRVPVTGQDTLLDFASRVRTALPFIASMRSRAGKLLGRGQARE